MAQAASGLWEEPAPPAADHATVVVVNPAGIDPSTEHKVVRALAAWARELELVIVCGFDEHAGPRHAQSLVRVLRELLPQRGVVAVLMTDAPGGRHELATVAGLVDEGTVAVAVTVATDARRVATDVARHLGTEAVLSLDDDGYRRIDG